MCTIYLPLVVSVVTVDFSFFFFFSFFGHVYMLCTCIGCLHIAQIELPSWSASASGTGISDAVGPFAQMDSAYIIYLASTK